MPFPTIPPRMNRTLWNGNFIKAIKQRYPETYTIWKNGSEYIGECNEATLADFTSIDAGVVFNACKTALGTLSQVGAIGIRNNIYEFTTPFVGGNCVDLIGESPGPFEDFTKGVVLKYVGANTPALLDYRACRSLNFHNIKLKNTGSAIRGIYWGDTTNSANKTKAPFVQNVVIDGFQYGIQGDTFGPDEGTYIHLYVGNNSVCGIDNLSNSRFYGGSIYSNPIGLRFGRAAGASADASIVADGLTFSGNPISIDLIGAQSMNILKLTGCWIENTNLVLNTQNSTQDIYIGDISFDNCVVTSLVDFFDLRRRSCRLKFDNGTLYYNGGGSVGYVRTDGAGGTLQKVRLNFSVGMDRVAFNDAGSGLHGWESAIFPFFMDYEGYQPASPVGGSYVSIGFSYPVSVTMYQVIKATACWRWNPNSTSGKIRFHSSTDFGASEPAANGLRYDKIDCTANVRGLGYLGDIDIQIADNNVTAPKLLGAWLAYEY